MCLCINYTPIILPSEFTIWRFPEIGEPPVIIDSFVRVSLTISIYFGYPQFMETHTSRIHHCWVTLSWYHYITLYNSIPYTMTIMISLFFAASPSPSHPRRCLPWHGAQFVHGCGARVLRTRPSRVTGGGTCRLRHAVVLPVTLIPSNNG